MLSIRLVSRGVAASRAVIIGVPLLPPLPVTVVVVVTTGLLMVVAGVRGVTYGEGGSVEGMLLRCIASMTSGNGLKTALPNTGSHVMNVDSEGIVDGVEEDGEKGEEEASEESCDTAVVEEAIEMKLGELARREEGRPVVPMAGEEDEEDEEEEGGRGTCLYVRLPPLPSVPARAAWESL